VDPDLLAAVTGAWLADRDRPGQCRRAVAVDGKTLRGAACDGRQVHLLAAMDHATRAVLVQRQVNGAPGEVPGFQPLLGDLELIGAVVTADALHTHAGAAEFLVTSSRPTTCWSSRPTSPRCGAVAPAWPGTTFLFWTAPATAGMAGSSCAPSRPSVRGFGFPHTAQVLQVTRRVRDLRSRRTVVVYAVTSLAHAQASPARLADLIRGHWAIENGLH
jgi:predicted transposase YbfD/YdcC